MSWVWFQDALGAGTMQFSMPADTGVYTLTGNATGVQLVASGGVFVLAGQAEGLLQGRVLGAGSGAYALSGGAIGPFVRTHLLAAARGEYKLSGPHIILHRTTVPITDPAPYVEGAWERPENEGNLDAQVEWEAG